MNRGFTFFLPPHFQHFPVVVRVYLAQKSRATCGSVFGQEPTRLVPNPTSITERFWPKWSGPPLWGFLDKAVAAPPRLGASALRRRSSLLLPGRKFSDEERLSCQRWVIVNKPRVQRRRSTRRRRGRWRSRLGQRTGPEWPNSAAGPWSFTSRLGLNRSSKSRFI